MSLTYLGTVYPQQIDHMGHMNVQYYASMFDQATWAFLSELGITSEYMKANRKGMAAVDQRTKYQHEVFAGDVLEVRTRLLEVKEKAIRFAHTMKRRPLGQVIATSELVGVHFDTRTHKACPFPSDVRKRLSASVKQHRA